MIELNCTLKNLLEEIDVSEASQHAQLTDPADPAFADLDEVTLHVRARKRRAILAPLQEAFIRRFPDTPPSELDRDLLYLLKKGLGNAFKHGNRDDPNRTVEVEVVSTRRGAVVTIRDQGPGFDVESAVLGFRRDRRYFHNKGSGFRNFEKALSRVSWTDHGRTLLLGFRCDARDETTGDPSGQSALGSLADPGHVLSIMKESIPQFRDGKWSALSCSVKPLHVGHDECIEFSCTTVYLKGKSTKPREKVWTGRVLPEHAAKAEIRAVRQLKGDPLGGRGGLVVPRARRAFDRHPGLVFHKVHADMDLTTYLSGLEAADVRDAFAKVALGLRDLHSSGIELESSEGREITLAAIDRRLENIVARLGCAGDAPIATLRRLLANQPSAAEWQGAPIHGRLGWDSVLYDDGRFFLWRFENARIGHPGLDVGSFLADLLLSPHPVELASSFTDPYFSELHAPWSQALPFFVAAGLLERLDRMLEHGDASPDLVSAMDRLEALTAPP